MNDTHDDNVIHIGTRAREGSALRGEAEEFEVRRLVFAKLGAAMVVFENERLTDPDELDREAVTGCDDDDACALRVGSEAFVRLSLGLVHRDGQVHERMHEVRARIASPSFEGLIAVLLNGGDVPIVPAHAVRAIPWRGCEPEGARLGVPLEMHRTTQKRRQR